MVEEDEFAPELVISKIVLSKNYIFFSSFLWFNSRCMVEKKRLECLLGI